MFKTLLMSAGLSLVLVTGTVTGNAQAQAGITAVATIDVVRTAGALPIRKSPPGPFSSKGRKLGKTAARAEYRVLSRKVVPSVFGGQLWVKISPVSGNGLTGWVYSGKARKGAPQNLR